MHRLETRSGLVEALLEMQQEKGEQQMGHTAVIQGDRAGGGAGPRQHRLAAGMGLYPTGIAPTGELQWLSQGP